MGWVRGVATVRCSARVVEVEFFRGGGAVEVVPWGVWGEVVVGVVAGGGSWVVGWHI